MPELTYREKQDQKRLESIRTMLLTLPRSCADFIRSLLSTTSTLTRLAYTIDLGTFFDFAMKELTCFSSENASQVTDEEIARLKPRDIEIYADYLSLYFRQTEGDTAEQRMFKNHTYGVMRKLSSLRSFFNYLFRTQRIPANIVTLVPLPKKHEKPILLLERDEMQKLLGTVYSGEQLTPQQAAFHKLTQVRDFAIVMLFLGTGIRVSECVGIDLEDLDFRNNALLVTRKGGNQVILYYPKEVADALRAYLDQRERHCGCRRARARVFSIAAKAPDHPACSGTDGQEICHVGGAIEKTHESAQASQHLCHQPLSGNRGYLPCRGSSWAFRCEYDAQTLRQHERRAHA